MRSGSHGEVERPARLGPYRLEEPLGAGGMGRVWRAWDERLQRRVAIKELRSDGSVANVRERLRREARAAARLNHPAVVQVYDLLESEGGDWIVMELVEGVTLRCLLDEQGPLSAQRAAQLGREIAEGLAEAHAHGLLHRDLKAVNVMVTPAGRAKILDFGVAKELAREGGQAPEPTLSAPDSILGTCHAMSPEQALGQTLDVRSDLFSLGSLLYEMLTGDPPFRGETPTVSLSKVLSFQPRPLRQELPEVPADFSHLVERLLAKPARLRPGSAGEVAAALATITALAPGTAAPFLPVVQPPLAEVSLWQEDATLDQRPWGQSGDRKTGGLRPESSSERRRQLGERRTVSVVCCGLLEAGEAGAEARFLDLETLSEAMAAFQELAREVCKPLGGQLGASLGHLLWLYFGYPQAHEDDPERAVRAARELMARAGELGGPFGGRRLAARAAVHTGPAVVMAHREREEQPQLGSTLDLATGLQSAAPAGGVVVSEASRRSIARGFVTEALPPVRLPGFDAPLPLFQVTGAVDARETAEGRSTLLVGRERELDLLLDRFRLARSGHGQTVMVSGEAGIGKSQLLRALRQSLSAAAESEAPLWRAGYGSAYAQSSPLAPVVDLLERQLLADGEEAAEPEEPADRKLDRLAAFLDRHGLPAADHVPLLAPLLSLPAASRYPASPMSPEAQRRRTLESLVALFAQMAERRPMVLVFEDLHWIDPSTLELLGALQAEIAALPMLLLMTFRPEFQAPWGHRANVTQLSLSRLGDREVETLIDRLAEERGLPSPAADFRRQILARTDGVPLFAEELTRAVLESGTTEDAELPSTLSGSLLARLDRLGSAKEVAQLASVLGRTFSLDLLAAISPLDRSEIELGLDDLLRAEVVHRRGLAAGARYSFKHALLQDAAYASLLSRERRELHAKTAVALEQRLEQRSGPRFESEAAPEIVARHYAAGGDPGKAAGRWLQAGQTALGRFANLEAEEHFRQGLAAVALLPPSAGRDGLEITFQSLLAVALTLSRGHAAPEVEAAYGRVLEIGERMGAIPQGLFPGLWAHYNARGDLRRALKLAEQMLARAEEGGSTDALGFALCAYATTHNFLGNLEVAAGAYEKLLGLFPAEGGGTIESNLGFDPRVLALGQLGAIRWMTGHPDAGVDLSRRALALAREIGQPFTIGLGLLGRVNLALSMRDAGTALEHARELVALCREQAFHAWATIGELALGCAEAAGLASPEEAGTSSSEEAGTLLRRALEAFQTLRTAYGQELDATRYTAWLAEACFRHGLLDEGEEILSRALADLEQSESQCRPGAGSERYWEPELHRLRGVLLVARGENGEPSFREAVAAARRLGALSLELRAATHQEPG